MPLNTIDPPILAPGSRLRVMTQHSFSDEAAQALREDNSPGIDIRYAPYIRRKDGVTQNDRGVWEHVMEDGEYGLLPNENSSTGIVVDHLNLLRSKCAGIIGEVDLQVRMQAGGVKGTQLNDVRQVYSHPVGIGQCSRFIAESLPSNVETHTADNTSIAARTVSELGRQDAIAFSSALALQEYGLTAIAEDIANLSGERNITQFYVIEANGHRELPDPKKEFHAAILRPLEYRGVLKNILGILKANRVGLSSLHSYKEDPNDPSYSFFVEMSHAGDVEDMLLLNEQLREYEVLESLHWLGSWDTRVYTGKHMMESVAPLPADPAVHTELDLTKQFHKIRIRPPEHTGSLHDVLAVIASAGVNLTALHSHTEGHKSYSFTLGLDTALATRSKMELLLRQLKHTHLLHNVEFHGSSDSPVA